MQPSAHEVSTKPIKMKSIKLLVLVLGITSLLLAGCKTCCQEKCSSAKAACGMECCTNAKTDCAHCPKCSAKK